MTTEGPSTDNSTSKGPGEGKGVGTNPGGDDGTGTADGTDLGGADGTGAAGGTVPGGGDGTGDGTATGPGSRPGRSASTGGGKGMSVTTTGTAATATTSTGTHLVSPDSNQPAVPTRTARVPKYYRLKRHLLDMTETLPPGTPVPPERTLAAEFDTSRTTVRQALQELVVEGRLERIQGKGTFVAKPKVSQSLQLTSYTEDMRAQGLEPTSQLLDIGYVTADDTLAGLLDITAGGRVLRIERLRLASGEPMAIETTHLSAKRFPALRRSLVKYTSLYTALAEVYDVRLSEAEETIETSLATPREAGLLGTDVGLPMLMLSRHSLDKDGEPVEWVRSVYRGDRYKFVARLRRPND